MKRSFRVKLGSQKLGRYSESAIRKRVERGEFTRSHRVSEDGSSWQSLKDAFPDLFAEESTSELTPSGKSGKRFVPPKFLSKQSQQDSTVAENSVAEETPQTSNTVHCSKCEAKLTLPDDQSEAELVCPYCGTLVQPSSVGLRKKKKKRRPLSGLAICSFLLTLLCAIGLWCMQSLAAESLGINEKNIIYIVLGAACIAAIGFSIGAIFETINKNVKGLILAILAFLLGLGTIAALVLVEEVRQQILDALGSLG